MKNTKCRTIFIECYLGKKRIICVVMCINTCMVTKRMFEVLHSVISSSLWGMSEKGEISLSVVFSKFLQ